MTTRSARLLFLPAAIIVMVYAAIFPLLTIDTLTRVLRTLGGFETRNLLLVLFLELSRLFTTIVALLLAVALILRGRQHADGRALAFFLLFAVIAYEQVFGSNGVPGPAQESVAFALRNAGVSSALLNWLFGAVPWAVWPAAAALLRFSAIFPRPLDPEMLDESGRSDRRGLLRSRGVAGLDVGALCRRLSKLLLARGAFRPVPLGAAAVLLVAAQTALHNTVASVALGLIGLGSVGVAFTNLRAGHAAAAGADRVRMTWIAEGFVLALFMFLVSAVVLLLVPGSGARTAAFILIMLTPAAISICLALSVLDRGELDSAAAIEVTIRHGTLAVFLALAFGALNLVLQLAAARLGMSHALAAGIAATGTAAGIGGLRKAADRWRLRVLERSR